MIESRILKSLADTHQFAREIAQRCKGRVVIGLQGDMGSGKTHFVRALAEELGAVMGEVSSPTFAVHQLYLGKEVMIHHVDLFRLESDDEVESSGFWDLFYEDDVVIAVEWIDRIDQRQIPENFSYLRLDWEVLSNGHRKISIGGRSPLSSPPIS